MESHLNTTDQSFFKHRLAFNRNKITLKNRLLNQSMDVADQQGSKWLYNDMQLETKVDNMIYHLNMHPASQTLNQSPRKIYLSTDGSNPPTRRPRQVTTPKRKRYDLNKLSNDFMEYAYKQSGLGQHSLDTRNIQTPQTVTHSLCQSTKPKKFSNLLGNLSKRMASKEAKTQQSRSQLNSFSNQTTEEANNSHRREQVCTPKLVLSPFFDTPLTKSPKIKEQYPQPQYLHFKNIPSIPGSNVVKRSAIYQKDDRDHTQAIDDDEVVISVKPPSELPKLNAKFKYVLKPSEISPFAEEQPPSHPISIMDSFKQALLQDESKVSNLGKVRPYKINSQLQEWKQKKIEKEQREEQRRRIEEQDRLFKEKLLQNDINYRMSQIIVSKFRDSEARKSQKQIYSILDFISQNGGTTRNLSKFKIKKLVEQLDFMVQMSEDKRQQFRKRLYEVMEKFEVDKTPFEKVTQEKIEHLKLTVKEFDQSIAMIQAQKNLTLSENYKIKNNVLLDMVDQNKHDKAFITQMEQAKPETRELINSLISTLEMPEKKLKFVHPNFIQLPTRSETRDTFQQSLSSLGTPKENTKYILKPEKSKLQMLIQKRKESFLDQKGEELQTQTPIDNTTRIKRKIEKQLSTEPKNSGLAFMQQIFTNAIEEQSDGSSSSQGAEESARGTKGQAMQKFRQIVCKHFLSISLSQLQRMDPTKMTMNYALRLANFKLAMDELLPEGSQRTIGMKYQALDQNLYENVFLQKLLSDVPEFAEQLNLKKKKAMYYSDDDSSNDEEMEEVNQYGELVLKRYSKDKKGATNYTLNQLFFADTEKAKFFQSAKKKNLNTKDELDVDKIAMKEYFQKCQEANIVVQPFFVSFEANILYLCKDRINNFQAKAMNHYLQQVRMVDAKKIFKLVIDQCLMKDDVFAEILEGCYKQSKIKLNGDMQIQYLTTIVYSYNDFGTKSLTQLQFLLPNLIELNFNNLSESGGLSQSVLLNLVESIKLKAVKLMKLRLSGIYINYQSVIKQICEILEKNILLQYIDFSWTSLSTKSICLISESLQRRTTSMRTIDFSYNRLNFNPDSQEFQDSMNFVENLCVFLDRAQVMTHLKLSGMGLGKEQLIKIAKQVIKCPLMLAVHLNDNEINRDHKFMHDLLDVFGLGESDLIAINRSQFNNEKLRSPKGQLVHGKIDYKHKMRSYLGFSSPTRKDTTQFEQAQALNKQRKQYKDHILLGKHQKIVDNFKAINSSQVAQGVGRLTDNQIDQFVISRVVNYPELIFNQRIKMDQSKQNKFFEKNAGFKWVLSKKNECYVCQKHRYTIIFYERGAQAKNYGLVEVRDKQFLDQLKWEFNKDYFTYKSMTPIICGTIVNKMPGSDNFERKLKMIRAPLFTLLCISGSKVFMQSHEQCNQVQNGILKFLEFDQIQTLQNMGISEKYHGWQQVLDDKCNNNELTDITQINPPNFEDDLTKMDHYIYSAFLPPGYHQLLIYDPICERAFCKDFIVGMNQKEFYPEFPLSFGDKAAKVVQNVWREWLEETDEQKAQSFLGEISSERFDISTFIKQEDDQHKCMEIMMKAFNLIKVLQKELIVSSSIYPVIDWDRVAWHADWIYTNTKIDKDDKIYIRQLEICYISATKADKGQGLRSPMHRRELIEYILRMAKSWVTQKISAREPVSQHLDEFLGIYLTPLYNKSLLIEHRNIIRKSSKLNELLFDNTKCLKLLYSDLKGTKIGLSFDASQKFFNQIVLVQRNLSYYQLQACYLFSQMTVLDESNPKERRRYDNIVYVEFLEMICRVAMMTFRYQDTVEYKVYNLLQLIYESRYQKGKWNSEEHKLIEVARDD